MRFNPTCGGPTIRDVYFLRIPPIAALQTFPAAHRVLARLMVHVNDTAAPSTAFAVHELGTRTAAMLACHFSTFVSKKNTFVLPGFVHPR